MRAAAASLLVLMATLTLFAYQQGIKPSGARAAQVPGEPAAGTARTLDLGVTTGPLATGGSRGGRPT